MKKSSSLLIGIGVVLIILVNILIFGVGNNNQETKLNDTTILFVQGSYVEYLEAIKKSSNRNTGEELYRQAIALIKLGKFDEAEEKFYKAYSIVQDPISEKLLRSVTLFNKGDTVGALKIVTNLRSKNSQEMSTIELLNGIYLIDQRGFKKATQILTKTLERDPASPATAFYLGLSQYNQSKRQASYTNFDRALSLGYEDPSLYQYLAQTSVSLKKWEEAMNYYSRVTKLQPDNILNRLGYGDVLVKNSRVDEAIQAYDSAIILDTENIASYRKKVRLLMTQERLNEAIQTYTSLEKLVDSSKSVEVWIEKMKLYDAVGNSEQRDELLQRIIVNIPEDIGLYSLFANKLMEIDRYEQAQRYIEFLVLRKSRDKGVQRLHRKWLIGTLKNSLGDVAVEENEVINELLTRYSKEADTKFFSMLAYAVEDDFGAALRVGQEISNSFNDNDIRLALVLYYLYEGNTPKAGEVFAVLDAEVIGEIPHLRLQWYFSSKSSDQVLYEQLTELLKKKVPGLTQDLMNESFESAFIDQVGFLKHYYPEGLF